ncbi:MAG: DUF1080 domain-containing protein [Bacteroidales bacterium]|nr:DUF1080 domain-containing protein [Bacteroidales bacterium]
MRKVNAAALSLMTFFALLAFTACSPSLPAGEKRTIVPDKAKNYFTFESAASYPDSLVLTERNASLVSRFGLKNFVFTVNMFTTVGAEGLICFHTGSNQQDTARGYAVMINNSDYRKGNLQKTGSLALIRNNFVRTVGDGEWFTLTIEVQVNLISVRVNDRLISEYTQPGHPERQAGLENRLLSEGLLVLRKTSSEGAIIIGEMTLKALAPDLLPAAETAFFNDSTGRMLTLLNQQGFPLIDFHAHLKGGLTSDQVTAHGRSNGYNYGLAPNCGLNFPVTNDSSLLAWYNEMKGEPVFKAMQCEGREWVTLFSPQAIAQYDYIFTDAMTWTDHRGRRMRLWIPEETFVDNEQQFMDMLVAKIEAVLSNEPVDIYVNPTYLPEVIANRYDQLWTSERMDRVIKVLVENDVALEINSRFRIPGLTFVRKAKAAGVKFTLGTNNADNTDLGRLDYSLWIIREAGITAADMFIPRPAGDRKVLKKGLPARITG